MSVSQAFQGPIDAAIDGDLRENGFVAATWRTEKKPAAPVVDEEDDRLDITEKTHVAIRISKYSYASVYSSLTNFGNENAVFELDRDARRAAVLCVALAEMERVLPRLRAMVANLNTEEEVALPGAGTPA